MQIYFKSIFKKLIYVTTIGLLLSSCGEKTAKPVEIPQDSLAQIEAVKEISKEIESDPENAELLYKRANIYYNQGYLSRAELDIETALKSDSSNALYLFFQGRIQYATNQTKKAALSYEKAIQFKADYLEAKLKLADLYFVVKEHKKSIDLLTNAMKQDPGNAVIYHTLGLNYKEMGDTARAIYNFQTAIENDPKDIESIIYIGNLYAAQRNPLAMEYFNSALKLRPKSVDALFGRAVFAQKMNFKKQALLDYKKIIDINPEHYKSYYNVGYMNFETGDYKEALRNWDIATRMNNFYPQAYYMKGLTYQILGVKKEARLNYEMALEQDPQYALAKEALEELK
jgi:tetratricopeptide (TPR) repeat protein